MERSKILKDLVILLRELNPDLQAIYLFGSVAKDTSSAQSDIDVALLCSFPTDQIRLYDQQQKISQVLKQEVDLVDLGSVSTVFQFQILTTGKRLYVADFDLCEQFENKVWQLYLTLNDDRKTIIEKIRETGSIYG